jgi:glucose/arabinose dehydrogenase
MPRSRFARILALLALLLPLLATGAEPGRAAEEIFFPETGQTLSDEHGFLTYWRTYGGLAQFGYPRTPEIREVNPADGRIYIVQWFERNRFEWHPENAGSKYEVLLGLLGNQIVLNRRHEPPFQPVADPGLPNQRYFPETGHTLRNSFRAYWEAHGGLELYGYPLTEEFTEISPTDGKPYVVQYFERNRFEWHPENSAPYDVLLGLLGNQIIGDPGTPEAPAASVAVPLAIPPQFASGPFATPRTFTLPPGFTINLYAAGLPGARMLAVAPNGDRFVSRKDAGVIVALPDRNGDGTADEARVFASGLGKPHGLAFFNGYLYVAQEASVIRFPYVAGDLAARGPAETVVPFLPNGPGSGLVGDVNHDTRSIAFGPDGKMYVSVGSSCDLCIESEERRATVLQFNADGSDGRIFASGLRNAVGVRVDPRTGILWATGNERNGLGDNDPPDFFVPLRAGVNYGWPYCVGVPPRPDPTVGAGREEYCRTQVETPLVPLQARTAPLGYSFTEGARLPAPFANGAILTQHGPFGRVDAGHRLIFLSMVPGRMQAGPRDFALGWVQNGTMWGNPVDVIVGPDGALYVSDDLAGAVYRIAYTTP